MVAVASSPTFGWFYKGRSRARGIGAARCGAIKKSSSKIGRQEMSANSGCR
jgi:hypothetical protein